MVRPGQVQAATADCQNVISNSFSILGFPTEAIDRVTTASAGEPMEVQLTGLEPSTKYDISCRIDYLGVDRVLDKVTVVSNSDRSATWKLSDDSCFRKVNFFDSMLNHSRYVYLESDNANCTAQTYDWKNFGVISCKSSDITISVGGQDNPCCFREGDNVSISIKNIFQNGVPYTGETMYRYNTGRFKYLEYFKMDVVNGEANVNFSIYPNGKGRIHKFVLPLAESGTCEKSMNVNVCPDEDRTKACVIANDSSQVSQFQLCNQISNKDAVQKAKCQCCSLEGVTDCGSPSEIPEDGGVKGLWTAVGCIPTSYKGITGSLLKIGLMAGGGIAFLQILGAAFILSTSEGEPKKKSDAQERITSAIIGLVFIIFSITILQFIGISILRIPGFGV